MKIFADENIPPITVQALRAEGHDVLLFVERLMKAWIMKLFGKHYRGTVIDYNR